MYSTSWSKIANQLVKPIENAAFTYLGAKLIGADGAMANPYWGDYSTPTQLAIGSGVSSVFTELVHNWVLPEVATGDQLYSTASMVLNPVLQASMLYAYANMSQPNKASSIGGLNLMLLGAGSEIVSTYVNDGFIQPWLRA